LEALRALVGHAPQPHAPQPRAAGSWLFGDKAYVDATLSRTLAQQDMLIWTPAKRVRGQKRLSAADKLHSTAVSQVRQPIESLFNWINEKTGIQSASKVRSYRGLMVHVFGRLTAAMLSLAFNP
jgi:hypothetical protein